MLHKKISTRKRHRSPASPIITSALFLSTLTAIFLLQGRAYRGAWLRYFGLDPAQFPITAADTYWLALNGWLHAALGWFNDAWDLYVRHLIPLTLPVALLAFCVFCWEWSKARSNRTESRNKSKASPSGSDDSTFHASSGMKSWLVRVVMSLFIAPVSLAVLPLTLFLFGSIFVCLIVVTVVPFENFGKDAAIAFCKQPIDSAAKIVLADNSEFPEWGYRIECNIDFCAMVRDGKTYVVPTRSISRIELPRPGDPPGKAAEKSQAHLCPVP